MAEEADSGTVGAVVWALHVQVVRTTALGIAAELEPEGAPAAVGEQIVAVEHLVDLFADAAVAPAVDTVQ